MPLPSGSNAAPPEASTGREASLGTGFSGGRAVQGTPSVRGGRPSFSGGLPSLEGNRRRSLTGNRRRSLSQMSDGAAAGPSPLDRNGWRGDLGQFQGPRARMQDRRRSFSVPLSPVASADGGSMHTDFDGDGEAIYVWGTNLTIASVTERIRRFYTSFKTPQQRDDDDAKYIGLIRQAVENEEPVLNVDCANIAAADPTLYAHLLSCPTEVIPLMDTEARNLAAALTNDEDVDHHIQVKTFNLQESKVIRDLNPADINCLISVSGMVTRTSAVIPDLTVATFGCEACGFEKLVPAACGRLEEPQRCDACNATWTMKLLHNRCWFQNKQLIKMQENPNAIPEGETPHAVSMFAFDSLLDVCKPGDRITVTGIYKAVPMRTSPRLRQLKAVYKTYIDVVHVEKSQTARTFTVAQPAAAGDASQEPATQPDADAEPRLQMDDITPEQAAANEAKLQALAREPDIYEKLTASVAPGIWQLDDIKKGLLCQLFGGTTKSFQGGKLRGELNVLLVGDPGTSKSQLLGYVHKLAPRGIYTSGRGSSAVGLTAYVTRDPETREMVLESGALVLSDQGVCCIDEFDKMSDSARSMLHEVMEQQTVSVAKAGIISTLNARTSVLASANPVGSRYNPRASIVDNIQLPPTLLSRFDLIYLVLDKADEASDRTLARHLVAMYHERPPPRATGTVPMALLREYIAYARSHCTPQLTDAAAAELVEGYITMRRQGLSRKVITATPRQLESGVRLAEALARMRLSPTVEARDVREGLRLMQVAMQQTAVDPTTGTIDMDLIQTGISAGDRMARSHLTSELEALIQNAAGSMSLAELLTRINNQSSVPVSENELKDALRTMGEGVVKVNWATRTVEAAA